MRNSLKTVVLGAIAVMFSASLQAEVHQHAGMNVASEGTSEQIIKGPALSRILISRVKKSLLPMMLSRRWAGPR